jgi:hypothetical protein
LALLWRQSHEWLENFQLLVFIEYELEVVNLDENPCFEALSYIWEPTSPPVKVSCHGQFLKVTPDLGAALQRL